MYVPMFNKLSCVINLYVRPYLKKKKPNLNVKKKKKKKKKRLILQP